VIQSATPDWFYPATVDDSRLFTVILPRKVLPKAGGKRGVETLLIDSDLFEPYERLVTIEILGRRVEVPENNRLLRCFQFLSMRSISYGDFCWNGDCTNCQFWYHEGGEQARADDKTALSCRFKVRESMVITRLNEHVKLEGINKDREERG
jgi:hypothetical protein